MSESQALVQVKVRRVHRESGEAISFTALAPSRRILGVVEILIPLMPGFSLSERIGIDQEKEILATAEDLVRRIAEGVLTEPTSEAR
jgi:hypothetical protein